MNLLVGLLVLSLASTISRAEDKGSQPNPEYTHWAKFKVGTWVKLKTVAGEGDEQQQMSITHKLVELTAEKAVVETSMSMEAMPMAIPGQRRVIPARLEPPKAEDAASEEAKKVAASTKQGEEELTVAGRKIKCQWTEVTLQQDGQTIRTKTWASQEVPGQMVKLEGQTADGKMSQLLVGLEVVK